MIEITHLSKHFKSMRRPALDKITLKVSAGETVGLIGENGAGKTTLMRLIATTLQPTKGSIKVHHLDTQNHPLKVRSKLGVLFGGDPGLYNRLTARENIHYFAALHGLDQKQIEANLQTVAERFEMLDYLDQRCGTFSRGMRQKTAMARALIHQPPILLLDEPTTGLDITAALMMREFIKECQARAITIIFSSHRLELIAELCPRILILHQGRLVFDQQTEEALKNNVSLQNIYLTATSKGVAANA